MLLVSLAHSPPPSPTNQVERGVAPVVETEFGPSPYLQTMPHSKAPVADLAAANLYIAKRQAQRYASRMVGSSV